jgi:hypothetical protein
MTSLGTPAGQSGRCPRNAPSPTAAPDPRAVAVCPLPSDHRDITVIEEEVAVELVRRGILHKSAIASSLLMGEELHRHVHVREHRLIVRAQGHAATAVSVPLPRVPQIIESLWRPLARYTRASSLCPGAGPARRVLPGAATAGRRLGGWRGIPPAKSTAALSSTRARYAGLHPRFAVLRLAMWILVSPRAAPRNLAAPPARCAGRT